MLVLLTLTCTKLFRKKASNLLKDVKRIYRDFSEAITCDIHSFFILISDENYKKNLVIIISLQVILHRLWKKWLFIKILQNSQESTCGKVSFVIKLQARKKKFIRKYPTEVPFVMKLQLQKTRKIQNKTSLHGLATKKVAQRTIFAKFKRKHLFYSRF